MPTENKIDEQSLPREIQLLPQEEVERRKQVAKRVWVTFLGFGILFIIVQFVALGSIIYRFRIERSMAQASQDLETVIRGLKRNREVEEKFLALEENVQIITSIRKDRQQVIKLLKDLEDSIPLGVVFNTLRVEFSNDYRLLIFGQTDNYLLVYHLIKKLEGQEKVKSVVLNNLKRENIGSPIEFSLTVSL